MDEAMGDLFPRRGGGSSPPAAPSRSTSPRRGWTSPPCSSSAPAAPCFLYNSGYDPSHRAANPGLVLIARSIGQAVDEGCEEYDFLRGTERYKYDLGGVDRGIYRLTVSA